MPKVTLYTRGDEPWDDPENEPCWAALAAYDPHDPTSLQEAREAVRQQFSLTYLPVLCNEPEPSFFAELLRRISSVYRAMKEMRAMRAMTRPSAPACHETVTE